jgi:hypothetical protein
VRGIRLQGLSVVRLCMHGQWLSAGTVDEDACSVSVDYGRKPCTRILQYKDNHIFRGYVSGEAVPQLHDRLMDNRLAWACFPSFFCPCRNTA